MSIPGLKYPSDLAFTKTIPRGTILYTVTLTVLVQGLHVS